MSKVVYALFTYNQESFVAEAVQSALKQDFPRLTIVISDDGSTDRTFEIIEKTVADHAGAHSVQLYRNALRLGWIDHFISIVETVGDAFIITAHGDDTSVPERTRRLVETWRHFNVSMVSSGARWLNSTASQDDGTRQSRRISAEKMVRSNWMPEMLGAALGFESSLLSSFERLDSATFPSGLDHLLPLRAALRKGFYYLNEPLIGYRRHAGNLSNFLADRSSSEAVHLDGLFSRSLAIRSKEHEELVTLMRRHPLNLRYRRLARTLERKIMLDLADWRDRRACLTKQGLMPTWVARQTIEAKPAKFEITF